MIAEGFTTKKAPEQIQHFDRSLGMGFMFGPVKPESTQTPPNRHQRRAQAAKAPRVVREMIQANKFGYKLRHQVYVGHPFHYLDLDAVAEAKWTEEELKDACKKVKNALRRRRQGRIK